MQVKKCDLSPLYSTAEGIPALLVWYGTGFPRTKMCWTQSTEGPQRKFRGWDILHMNGAVLSLTRGVTPSKCMNI